MSSIRLEAALPADDGREQGEPQQEPWDGDAHLATFSAPFHAEKDASLRQNSVTSNSSVCPGPGDEASLIAGRFRLDEAIGEGTWGEVMKGVDTATKEPIAAKATRHGSVIAVASLIREFLAYCALSKFRGRETPVAPQDIDLLRSADSDQLCDEGRASVAAVDGVVGVAQVLHFESTLPPHHMDWSVADGNVAEGTPSSPSACLILRVLGPSLEQLRQYCLGCFDMPTILMLADQAVGRIEHLHRCGIVHRDLKPENFLMGVGGTAHVLYLIDFGLVTTYQKSVSLLDLAGTDQDFVEAVHVEPDDSAGVAGTQRYASADAMRGKRQSRRDDMQALVYCLVFLATGSLPWKGKMDEGNPSTVIQMKSSTPTAELCAKCPYLQDFVDAIFSLEFSDTPKYGALRYELRRKMAEQNIRYDYSYCWARKRLDELHRGLGV